MRPMERQRELKKKEKEIPLTCPYAVPHHGHGANYFQMLRLHLGQDLE